MRQSVSLKAAVVTTGVAATVMCIVWAAEPAFVGVRSGHVDADYLASKNCIVCHPAHYDSWARTFHSRMTQEASPESVRGDFEHRNTYEFLNVRARMEKRDTQYVMSFALADGRQETYIIERTVGSRRIQQYVANRNGQRTRLPLAYDLVNRRWMSLNGSFFFPDGAEFFQHQATWDANCVFCHNVKAQPNMNPQTRECATEVAELGIACGACHARAARHVEAAASPWTRALWRLNDRKDTHIVHPAKLTSERSMMICGHCHGQRVPDPIDRVQSIMTHGDPFDAGDDLSEYYRPVTRDTTVGNYSFASRFWKNGSPRLTAYEYQGILRSKCYQRGRPGSRIHCLTCHSMHAGDPMGQITPENRTNQPCLTCHPQFSASTALAEHTRHRADGVGSLCYNCHMPRVVYGIMSFHPTHDITVPDPRLTISDDVPNACNQCHLDKSASWALHQARRWWPRRFGDGRSSGEMSFDKPEGVRELFAGDALTRALAAEALSGGGPMGRDWQNLSPGGAESTILPKLDSLATLVCLIEACADDYPIVRYFALQGIEALEPRLERPDYIAPCSVQRPNSEQLARELFKLRRDASPSLQREVSTLARSLRERRSNVDLDVGE
ncbi:MAG: hypothetical protein U1A27_13190 [Phycisphaerae bacterium]